MIIIIIFIWLKLWDVGYFYRWKVNSECDVILTQPHQLVVPDFNDFYHKADFTVRHTWIWGHFLFWTLSGVFSVRTICGPLLSFLHHWSHIINCPIQEDRGVALRSGNNLMSADEFRRPEMPQLFLVHHLLHCQETGSPHFLKEWKIRFS